MKEKMKNAKKIISLLAIIIFGATLFGCSTFRSSIDANAGSTPVTAASPVSAGELTKEYEKSKESVRSKYDGKEIVVRGYAMFTATMVERDSLMTEAGGGLISLTEKDLDSELVKCWFGKADAPEFSKIKGDQFVTVKGIFSGDRGTELKFCKLVKIE